MAITRQTLRIQRQLRITVGAEVDQVTRRQVEAWVRAWDELHDEMTAAVDELLLIEPGQWPTAAQVARATRAQAALAHAQETLARLAEDTRVDVTDVAGRAINLGAEEQPRILASQLPPAAGDAATLAVRFDRIDPRAIDAIVARAEGAIVSDLKPLADDAAEAMRRALIRGVAVGDNPRTAARAMVKGLESGFNGGLTRAMVVARTEILDAHRAGSAAQQQANADVLAGWVWLAQLDTRTCPSCWSQHGQLHPLEEAGPLDHQQGRCARMPKTRTWADLGFTVPEPPDLTPDAEDVFWALPDADRLEVMGADRLAALASGRASWADLSQRRTTSGWRDSFAPTPVRQLVA